MKTNLQERTVEQAVISPSWTATSSTPKPGGGFRLNVLLTTMLVFFATAMFWSTGAAAEPETVGDLGGEERLVIEGNKAYTKNSIIKTLSTTLDFHMLSHPTEPLTDYLAWLEKMVTRGYQHDGFAEVQVKAQADRPAKQIKVVIKEGAVFLCGDVKISGLDKKTTGQLKDLLRKGENKEEAAKSVGATGFIWVWRKGEPAPSDCNCMANMESAAEEALAELNRYQAKVRVEIALNKRAKTADLMLKVENPGITGILDQISITGLNINTREQMLDFLHLRPGMALSGSVTNDVIRRIYESGRFRAQAAKLSAMPEPGRFRLDVAVVEQEKGPALNKDLSPEQKALLKFRDWLMKWDRRSEDWVLEADGVRDGQFHQAEVVLGPGGLATIYRQTPMTNKPASSKASQPKPIISRALIATPKLAGIYSRPQMAKIVGEPEHGQLTAFVLFDCEPRADGTGSGNMTFGGGYSTDGEGPPFKLKLDLAPAAFARLTTEDDMVCRIEKNILTARSPTNAEDQIELVVEAATGKLIRFSASFPSENQSRVKLRFEKGALAAAIRAVEKETANFKNSHKTDHPWTSSLAFLWWEMQEVMRKEFPGSLEAMSKELGSGLTADDLLGVMEGIESLPWSEWVSSLDSPKSDSAGKDEEKDFPCVTDRPPSGSSSPSDWIRLIGGMILRGNDNLMTRGSWPWSLCRDATFLAAGRSSWARGDVAKLAASEDTGPLGCLAAGHLFGQLDPDMAGLFASEGGKRVTVNALQKDLQVLLCGEQSGPKFMRGALQHMPTLQGKNLMILMKLLGTNNLPIILEGFTALTANTNLPPDKALRPVIERHWEKTFRPYLLTEFAKGCFTKFQKNAGPPSEGAIADAVVWLKEAAELNYARAQMQMGELCKNGVGMKADPEKAAMWYRRAAEQDYPHAACELARLYRSGSGVQQSNAEAARWFRREADRGCTGAMFGLAQALMAGQGVSREDREEADRWMHKAADMNSTAAQEYLAIACEKQGDMQGALSWRRKAANTGSTEAQRTLGEFLSDGVSVKPDYVEAWIWFTLAAEQGDRFASGRLRTIERKLTPTQLEEAKQMLRKHSEKKDQEAKQSALPQVQSIVPTGIK